MPPDSVLEAVQASSPVKLGEGGCGKHVQLHFWGTRRCQDDAAAGEEAGNLVGNAETVNCFFAKEFFANQRHHSLCTSGSEKPTEESTRERDLGVGVGRDSLRP